MWTHINICLIFYLELQVQEGSECSLSVQCGWDMAEDQVKTEASAGEGETEPSMLLQKLKSNIS